MIEYGLEWHTLDSYFQFKEITAPATPQANQIRQYAADSSGISTMCWKNDAGNVTCLSTGGGTIPTGSGGVSGAVAFWTSATALGADDTHFHWDDTNDQLLIGINSGSHFGTDAGLVVDEDAANSIIGSIAHSATATHSGSLNLGRSRGTHAAQTIVADADRISRIVSQGYDGAAYRDAAAIDAIVNGVPGSNDMPGALQFLTTPDGSITLAIRATLDQKGDLGLGTVTPNYAGFTRALTIESATNTALELASSRADADGAGLGFIDARYKTNSANHNRVASILFSSSGTTVNQRGGMIQLSTKADASTTLSERFRVGPSGQWGIGGATFGNSGDIFSSGGAAAAPTWVTRATLNAALDHGLLIGLGDDDHTQYALLAGRSGGQTLIGGTAASNPLNLQSTSNATRGDIVLDGADLTFTSSMRARMASQNRFRHLNSLVTAYQSTAQTGIAHTTWTTMTFTSEAYDTDTLHDNATNTSRLTAALTGKYLVSASMYVDVSGVTAGLSKIAMRILVNGSTAIIYGYQDFATGTPTDGGVSTNAQIALTATDYVEVQVIVLGTLGTWATSTAGGAQIGRFSMAYIGE